MKNYKVDENFKGINPQFLCHRMQLRDLKHAFNIGSGDTDYIYNVLIRNGLIVKHNERYFLPTDLLLDFAFVPSIYWTTKEQRRFFVFSSFFTKEDILTIFGGGLKGEALFKAMIRNNYLRLDAGRRYRLAEELGERMAEGDEQITFNRVWEER